jgi:hypothetical protein
MQILPDCAQVFAELTTEVQTAMPIRVSEILYEAGYLMLLAGEGHSAYRAFSHLLNGEFAVNKSNRTLFAYLESVFPSLCHYLRVPYPKTPEQEELSISKLQAMIEENEQRSIAILFMDRFLPPPRATSWSEEYISRLINEEQPELSELSCFFQDAYRSIQSHLRSYQIDEAAKLLKIYELVSQKSESYRRGWISSEVLVIAVLTYLELGREEEAKQLLLNCWDQSNRDSFNLNQFLSFTATRNLILSGIFREKVNISQEAIAFFFDVLTHHSYTPQLKIPTVKDWEKFMENWNARIFAEDYQESFEGQCEYWAERFPMEVEQKNCSRPPATAQEILELEKRLGTALPTSYRNFLLYSNGWNILNSPYCHGELCGTSEIAWFKERNLDWIEGWHQGETEDETSDEEYFQYGKYQDCVVMRRVYLRTALQISSDEDCEGDIYLLNPKIIDSRGEWEAWDFGNKHPGAYRYQSFWEMMQAVYERSFSKE